MEVSFDLLANHDDITHLARSFGMRTKTFIDRELKQKIRETFPETDDNEEYQPLFHVVAPLKFLSERLPSTTKIRFGIRNDKSQPYISILAKFGYMSDHGYFFAISEAKAE